MQTNVHKKLIFLIPVVAVISFKLYSGVGFLWGVGFYYFIQNCFNTTYIAWFGIVIYEY